MTITNREYSDLINYFTIRNVTDHIISLALTVNESADMNIPARFKLPATGDGIGGSGIDGIGITITPDQSWDNLDVLASNGSSTTAVFLSFNADNSSSSFQFPSNDTMTNHSNLLIPRRSRSNTEIPIWLIPCYSIILFFAIVGNLLVASTLFRNRRMRTITNVFLANLAISDMLLGVLCMPITLVGTYLRHFIFGELVCKFIQFAQAASVAVSSWTLVAISCERYYAICHPLRSRTWQTINHAYKIIGCIWFGSIVCMAPIAIFSQLIPTSRQGLRKCREQWPEQAVGYERSYNIFLDLVLLVLPLGILCIAYILITRTLYLGIKDEKALIFGSKNNNVVSGVGGGGGGGNTHPPASSSMGDGKVYTHVGSAGDAKTTNNVFKLNFSFRYANQKSGPLPHPPSSSSSACINTQEMLQIVKPSQPSRNGNGNGNSKEIKSLAPMSGDSVATYTKISNNEPRIHLEREAVGKSTKESHNEIQRLQSHDKQPQNHTTVHASTSSSSIQLCYDDITQLGPNVSSETSTASIINPLNSKRAIVAKTTDGRRQQLYCMRSASFKSFNRSSRTSADSEDTTSSSCHSLNALSTKFQRHSKLPVSGQQSALMGMRHTQYHQQPPQQSSIDVPLEKRKLNASPSLRITESALRRSNLEKNLESKKRVVKMLFVLVLEFFICWTPLYVINTVAMFIGPAIYEYVDYTTISFFQLLAYSSSCCNPITYCFMNAGFRRAFVDTFRGIHLNGGSFWHKSSKTATNLSMAGNSIAMGNSCTVMTANTVLDSPRL
ncbi:uncharacterized protein LOC142232176 [Haematobia irritans]|uniref:uncharacterized protein LOC142232176 n=1 Tax=Haematobia irritans TaxID=7368 RepID=UPI003F5039CE